MLFSILAVLFLIGGAVLLYIGLNNELKTPRIIGIILLVIALAFAGIWTQTESGARRMKSLKSDTVGGLERTVDVYDQNGNLIRTYAGKIDIQDTEYGNKVLFDLDGKRTVLYNATVIVQEK